LSQALWLALKELRQRWIGFVMMIVFVAFMGLLMGGNLAGYLKDPQSALSVMLVDYMLILVLPSFGTVWSLREEPFLKRLGFLRMWPIPLSVIVWSRLIYSLICYLTTSLFWFAGMTFGAWPAFESQLSLPVYGHFILFWFGYGLALSGIYAFLEFGFSFKLTQFIYFVVAMFMFVGLLFWHVVNWQQGRSISEWALRLVQTHEAWPGLAACLVAVAFIGFWKKLMTRRITRIDLP